MEPDVDPAEDHGGLSPDRGVGARPRQDHRRDRPILGGLAVLAVLAFHFPEYLTMPDLRQKYDVNVLREILLVGMVIAGGMALANLIRLRNRWLNGTALALIGFAVAPGGHRVSVGEFPDNTPYVGLDWFLLDLLGSSLMFILIEKLMPLHRGQPVFRPDWQVDFTHSW